MKDKLKAQKCRFIGAPETGENKSEERNITAVQQLAETFGSLDEVLKLFDDILHRMTWAYAGVPRHYFF